MKSRIWRVAGVGLLCLGVSAQSLAEGPSPQDQLRGSGGGGNGGEQRGNGGGHSNRGDHDSSGQGSQSNNSLPIQSKPSEVRQYQTGPRPDDRRWDGRPDGHGNGWGSGPQYRPGHLINSFPERHWRVPYRGRDFFYSGGYWYRPQGPSYVVVRPPYGIRVTYLPSYAQEVWVGSALFFLLAGTYYQYLDDSREYVVVNPPQVSAQPLSNSYDVVAYPAYGQSPQQVDQDRYECHRWAVEQSGFDPASASYAPADYVVQNYRRAMAACLSGRGYSVN
ncbi:DUF6515 family protein [Pseudomonas sp. R5(2019)]|uniref:DUF6515 family protein n=1 Tax=Pseudomonas sp. R5(2019) TaxID=2697566 RepID=UPI00141230E4|nr:DUF6515 family protein [Pseudomonas sp. R5(2019)]NBA97453.1 glycine zipper family protein [Pseudomonas sp. R5(2019)]